MAQKGRYISRVHVSSFWGSTLWPVGGQFVPKLATLRVSKLGGQAHDIRGHPGSPPRTPILDQKL
jgi:hypothetical protein